MNEATFSKDPVSVEFNSSMGTETGRKARLGDPDNAYRVHPQIAPHVRAAHTAFVNGHATVARLGEDETRTSPLKHEAARTVALRAVAAIENAQQSIVAVAHDFETDAEDSISRFFAADPARAVIQLEIGKWIGETAKAKDGLKRIRAEMQNDPEIVIVLQHSKPYIMGLASDVRDRLLEAGYRMHQPDAMRKIDDAVAMRELAAKYPKVTKGIRSSWFNNAIAEKAKSRVEI